MKIFHHNDADGRLSAFLLWRVFRTPTNDYKLEESDLIEMDYENPFPLDIIKKDELVFVVDYSFSKYTYDTLKKLINKTKYVVWIDHHKDFLDLENNYPWTKNILGLRRANITGTEIQKIKFSGAALVYIWLYGLKFSDLIEKYRHAIDPEYELMGAIANTTFSQFVQQIPLSKFHFRYENYKPQTAAVTQRLINMIKYVSDYDTFSNTYEDIKYFYYGINYMDQSPTSEDSVWVTKTVTDVKFAGVHNRAIIEKEMETYLEHYGFITEVNGIRCLAVNRASNSFIFDSIKDIDEKFPLRMVFYTKGTDTIKVTFFGGENASARDAAMSFGGGGHPGAAGCQIPMKDWNFKCIERYKTYLERIRES